MGRDTEWLRFALRVIALQAVFAVAVAVAYGFFRRPPLIESLVQSVIIAACAIAVIALAPGRPIRDAIEDGRPSIMSIIVGLALLSCQFALLTWFKMAMPVVWGGFPADPFLADLDKAIFGVDPWRLLRIVPGATLFEFAYFAWIAMTTVAITTLLGCPPSEGRTASIKAFFLVFAIGGVGQYVMPSAGPLFYDLAGWGDRFVAMGDVGAYSTLAKKWLWQFHLDGTVKAGIGISAMPSMHVAASVWLALTCQRMTPLLFPAALYFSATVYFATVYFGFHYFTDGLAGAAIAVLAFRLVSPNPKQPALWNSQRLPGL